MDLSNVSSEDLLELADTVTRLKNLKDAIKEYDILHASQRRLCTCNKRNYRYRK